MDFFVQCHPNIVLRNPASLSVARVKGSDPICLNNYFDVLEATLDTNDLMDKPLQIFNLDETGLALDPAPLNAKRAFKRGGTGTGKLFF